VLLIILAGVAGTKSNGQGSGQLGLDVQFDGRASHLASGHVDLTFNVTNRGAAPIENLVIFYDDGSDNWLDHHVVQDVGSCSIDKGLKAFRCGPLGAGQTATIQIAGTQKDRGNFNYSFGFADAQTGGGLRQWGQVETWSEAVS
jgi:hypothetical protein